MQVIFDTNHLASILMTGKLFFSIRVTFTDTDDTQGNRGRDGTIFIPLYYVHSLTSIQTFTGNLLETFHVRQLPRSFNRPSCNYPTATR